jgi:hypothetical protein
MAIGTLSILNHRLSLRCIHPFVISGMPCIVTPLQLRSDVLQSTSISAAASRERSPSVVGIMPISPSSPKSAATEVGEGSSACALVVMLPLLELVLRCCLWMEGSALQTHGNRLAIGTTKSALGIVWQLVVMAASSLDPNLAL